MENQGPRQRASERVAVRADDVTVALWAVAVFLAGLLGAHWSLLRVLPGG